MEPDKMVLDESFAFGEAPQRQRPCFLGRYFSAFGS